MGVEILYHVLPDGDIPDKYNPVLGVLGSDVVQPGEVHGISRKRVRGPTRRRFVCSLVIPPDAEKEEGRQSLSTPSVDVST